MNHSFHIDYDHWIHIRYVPPILPRIIAPDGSATDERVRRSAYCYICRLAMVLSPPLAARLLSVNAQFAHAMVIRFSQSMW